MRELYLDSDALHAIERAARTHYGTVTLPTMATGATDMAYLHAKGMEPSRNRGARERARRVPLKVDVRLR
jgi:hypothetical protein